MQKLKFANILVIAGLATGLVGCGKDFSGSYQYNCKDFNPYNNKKTDKTITYTLEKTNDNEYILKETTKDNVDGRTYESEPTNVTLKNDKYLIGEFGSSYGEFVDKNTFKADDCKFLPKKVLYKKI